MRGRNRTTKNFALTWWNEKHNYDQRTHLKIYRCNVIARASSGSGSPRMKRSWLTQWKMPVTKLKRKQTILKSSDLTIFQQMILYID